MRSFFRGAGQPFTKIRPIGNKAKDFDLKRFRMHEPAAYFSTIGIFIIWFIGVTPLAPQLYTERPDESKYLINDAHLADEWRGMGFMEKRRGDGTDMGPTYQFHYNDGTVFEYNTYNEHLRVENSQYNNIFRKVNGAPEEQQ
mmetsp:Transcript_6869/g.10048  ORF Transcript_6869/g.10048 Transcript_6869/m.10048 type:complete len:142 (+) Transcript_6869:31-456(+)